MLPEVASKPTVAIVGPGRLGSALTTELNRAGYSVTEIISREKVTSLGNARRLAKLVQARTATTKTANYDAGLIWLCVPDREIVGVSRKLAASRLNGKQWKGKTVFHSSGALTSDELNVLRKKGAVVASVHPLMTFVGGSIPSLRGVPFAVEGDAAAVRLARQIVEAFGGEAFTLRKKDKVAYHAWGTFASPLLLAALVMAERVARAAGLSAVDARRKMLPIVRQTVANYARLGPAGAFSGPIVRGDTGTVRQHLQTLKRIPEGREAYLALARVALRYLPARNRDELKKVLTR